jgi:pimeloyl-ACP methyl ester carboxylesterase
VSSAPEVRYAKSGDVHIAYQVTGDGPFDLIYVPGFTSNLHENWEPPLQRVFARLSSFCRLILFDKRGTGLSDPIAGAPTLEERMDDVRAVLDEVGSERPALFGFSEGGAMSLLFAATYPERTRALALWGAMARTTYAPDYPFAPPRDAYEESRNEFIMPYFGVGTMMAEIFTPSLLDNPAFVEEAERNQQRQAPPGTVLKIAQMYLDIDVRHVVEAISAPTLIMHARGDRAVNVRHGRWLGEHIRGAKYVEFPGIDHGVIYTNPDPVLDEVEEFLTGARPVADPDRVLATVMFTDIVGSTEKAATLGDTKWRQLLEAQQRAVRGELERHRGREVKSTGDGFLATFDGPGRAVRCGQAIVDGVKRIGLDTRVGLHAGEVEMMGADVGGIAVHIASRVGALAGAGEVLVSETVKGIVAGSGLQFEERGEHELKGVPDRWRLFSLRR